MTDSKEEKGLSGTGDEVDVSRRASSCGDVDGAVEREGEVQGEVEVEVPYSIYTPKEKWLIVGMVALAGFYRYTIHTTNSQLHT